MKTTLGAPAGGVVLALALAGCGAAGHSHTAAVAPTPVTAASHPAAATPSPSAAPASTAQLAATLQRAALKATDLGPGYAITLESGGAKVKGQATLEICGFKFNSEAHRLVRRAYQAVESKTGDYAGIENELVAYDSPAAAEHALAEWQVAADTCPAGVVTSTGPDVPPLSYTLIQAQSDLTTLPIKANILTSVSASLANDSLTDYDVTIIQVQGQFLHAVVAEQNDPVTPRDVQVCEKLAKETGLRLAPPSAA